MFSWMKMRNALTAASLAALVLTGCTAPAGTDVNGQGEVSFKQADGRGGVQGDIRGGGGGADIEGSDGLTFTDAGPMELQLNCGESPYPFGCPCLGNDDCLSGYCVEGTNGGICTQTCMEECPDGWKCKGLTNLGSDLVFLCVPTPKQLCFPCKKDAHCAGGKCVAMEGGSYCGIFCDEENPCPDGFGCDLVDEDSLCLPTSGACDCLPDNEGQLKPCEESNELGSCYGYAECVPGSGWSACTASMPAPEECDGKDNDCDALIDEDLPEGEPCENTNDHGSCKGTSVCMGPMGYLCQAPEPDAEACDYVDNDCDGLTDEEFLDADGKYADFFYCGSCSVNCALGFPNAKAKCDATKPVPKCVVDVCDPGYYKLNDYQCIPNTASLCEPCTTDDNCMFEKAKCVALDDGSFCAMACQGDVDCPDGYLCKDTGGSQQCLPQTNSCTCTGDNVDLSKSCSATWPAQPEPGEPSITCYGMQFCSQDGWSDCELPEEECDGLDNDCNGVMDDPFIDDAGKYVTDSNCGKCGNNCSALELANADGICNTDKAIPDCKVECKDGFFDVNENPADGCECAYSGQDDPPDGIDQNCDGVDGEISNAIFVAKNGNDAHSGTIEKPMLSINAAAAKAEDTEKRDVYVATGVYSESVIAKEGVSLYGGYSSDFKVRHVLLYETVIMGEEPTMLKPGAVTISNVKNDATSLDGFTIFGYDVDDTGSSSYAIYLRDSTDKVSIKDCHIYAGNGGDGSGGLNGLDGTDGKDGKSGSNAYLYATSNCVSAGAVSSGGNGGSNSCGGVSVSGGAGGASYCPYEGGGPKSGEKGGNGAGPAPGSSGSAGWDAIYIEDCGLCSVPSSSHPTEGSDGNHGPDGFHGSSGSGCSQTGGSVVAAQWVPGKGGSGSMAGHGSGGGGGGSGGGAEVHYTLSCKEQIGGTGGGGGAGACAGTGGTGGGGGGGTFGIFLFFSVQPATVPVITGNYVSGGNGGDGGLGGNAGTGGVGGNGAAGGDESQAAWCARGGGNGGNGGNGGHGGGGGGGCGGVSYCVYSHGQGGSSLNAIKNGNTFVLGTSGSGGSGGPSIGNPGQQGGNGMEGATNF